jgi:hypothetical protein
LKTTPAYKAVSLKEVIPRFIFDPVSLANNPYRGDNCIQAMLECLADLDRALRRSGRTAIYISRKPADVLTQIALNDKIVPYL